VSNVPKSASDSGFSVLDDMKTAKRPQTLTNNGCQKRMVTQNGLRLESLDATLHCSGSELESRLNVETSKLVNIRPHHF
jgi:hypothetical protein